jgi:hypothetical protein
MRSDARHILLFVLLGASPVSAQYISRTVDPPPMKPLGASTSELFVGATAGGVAAGFGTLVTAATLGLAFCEAGSAADGQGLFGRCFPPPEAPLVVGWHMGSYFGNAGAAAALATRRGCSKPQAMWRSALGAAVGSLPGILASLNGDRYPARRTWTIAATPVFGGIGAALTVIGCHTDVR